MRLAMRTWVLFVALLVVLALMRAEQGVAELEGRPAEPTRILRLAPAGRGEWRIWFLGLEGSLDLSNVAAFAARASGQVGDGLRRLSGVLP